MQGHEEDSTFFEDFLGHEDTKKRNSWPSEEPLWQDAENARQRRDRRVFFLKTLCDLSGFCVERWVVSNLFQVKKDAASPMSDAA
jgi:hypothetical protein